MATTVTRSALHCGSKSWATAGSDSFITVPDWGCNSRFKGLGGSRPVAESIPCTGGRLWLNADVGWLVTTPTGSCCTCLINGTVPISINTLTSVLEKPTSMLSYNNRNNVNTRTISPGSNGLRKISVVFPRVQVFNGIIPTVKPLCSCEVTQTQSKIEPLLTFDLQTEVFLRIESYSWSCRNMCVSLQQEVSRKHSSTCGTLRLCVLHTLQ